MPIIYREITHKIPDLYNYIPEYNEDGTEKHIYLDDARFHVISYGNNLLRCSERNCEMNK